MVWPKHVHPYIPRHRVLYSIDAMSVYCTQCVEEIPIGAKFCCYCGSPNNEFERSGDGLHPIERVLEKVSRSFEDILDQRLELALRPIYNRLNAMAQAVPRSHTSKRSQSRSRSCRRSVQSVAHTVPYQDEDVSSSTGRGDDVTRHGGALHGVAGTGPGGADAVLGADSTRPGGAGIGPGDTAVVDEGPDRDSTMLANEVRCIVPGCEAHTLEGRKDYCWAHVRRSLPEEAYMRPSKA